MNQGGRARARARELLASGYFPDARGSAEIGDVLRIEAPKGRLHSWWAPVVDGKQLVGYLTLLPDLTPLASSRFGSAVEAASWMDAARVRARAHTLERAGESARDAYLSFDGSPARIAWAVELVDARTGRARTVFVAGDSAWERGLQDDEIGGATDVSRR